MNLYNDILAREDARSILNKLSTQPEGSSSVDMGWWLCDEALKLILESVPDVFHPFWNPRYEGARAVLTEGQQKRYSEICKLDFRVDIPVLVSIIHEARIYASEDMQRLFFVLPPR